MNNKTFKWAVIGAGGAGIAAVGKLLDHHIKPQDIVWIDPYFEVGDLGRYWLNVHGNTSVKYIFDFLNGAKSFHFHNVVDKFEINKIPPDQKCTINHIVEPLQWITDQFSNTVHTIEAFAHHLKLDQRQWVIETDSQTLIADSVIIANGASPHALDYPEAETIPFHMAIDKKRLSDIVNKDGTYAVFGSSHSAMMIMNHLVDLKVKKIINFYRSPCRYAIDMGDWMLFDNTGLKGKTAQWARDHIDGIQPDNLERYQATKTNISQHLPNCDHAIYAVGFRKRNNIVMNHGEPIDYNPQTGIIAPGLFGLGIAYPELKIDPMGISEYQVGLWKFMTYLNEIMPLWLKYHA